MKVSSLRSGWCLFWAPPTLLQLALSPYIPECFCNNTSFQSLGFCTQTTPGWMPFSPSHCRNHPHHHPSSTSVLSRPQSFVGQARAKKRSSSDPAVVLSTESTTLICHCFHSEHCKVPSFCSIKTPDWNANSATFLLLTISSEHRHIPDLNCPIHTGALKPSLRDDENLRWCT